MGHKRIGKLVRDKIPCIIEQQGKTPLIRTMEDNEYYRELKHKLEEELEEFLASDSIEELCDVQEVINTILQLKNVSTRKFDAIRLEKQKRNGGFEHKIYLIDILDE